MATTDYQQQQGIRTKFRSLVKESDTTKLPNATIDILINDFFRTCFLYDIETDVFDTDFTQAVTATDTGEYSLGATISEVNGIATFNGEEIVQYFSKDNFFRYFPDYDDKVLVSSGTILSIGVSSKSAVTNAAFDYVLTGYTYTKATAETELSGDTVPQSKYGAWLLSIDSDGTITVSEAGGNGTGYDTAGLAIAALAPTGDAVIGYVTVIDSDSTFIPGTTDLDASGVTATYTDGNPAYRETPRGFLVDGRKLFIRPKSNDKGLFQAKLQVKAPSDLSGDSDTVFNELWGNAIAVGCAVEYLQQNGNLEKAMALKGDSETPGTYKYYTDRISRAHYLQNNKRTTKRAF
jgi:hypothetical protein